MGIWFNINPAAPMPLYAQLERAIRFAIGTGELGIGDKLPTVRQLAVDLAINANTVAKVYAQLERDGVLQTTRGVGTFVKERYSAEDGPLASRRQQLDALVEQFLAEADAAGFTLEEVLEQFLSLGKKGSTNHG
jgi:GntR family transcriptional regulator